MIKIDYIKNPYILHLIIKNQTKLIHSSRYQHTSEKFDAIFKYEWAFSDFGSNDKLYSKWKSIPGVKTGTDKVMLL